MHFRVYFKVRLDVEINFTVMFGLSVRRRCHVSIVCRTVWSRLTWLARCWEEVNRGSEVMDGRVGGDDSKVMWREIRCASRRFRFPFSVVVSV